MVYVYGMNFETAHLHGMSGCNGYQLCVVYAVLPELVVDERKRKLGSRDGYFKLL